MKLFLARDLIDGTPRKAMTPARRKRLLDLNDNRCQHEGCEITTGLELDHDIPLALGGTEDDGNMVALCHAHHKEKTRGDVWRIAKAKRQRKLIEEVEPSRRPIPQRENPWPAEGRPFPKSNRKLRGGGFSKWRPA